MARETDDDLGVISVALTADNRARPVFGVFYYCTCLCWTLWGEGYFGQFRARFYGRHQLLRGPGERGLRGISEKASLGGSRGHGYGS